MAKQADVLQVNNRWSKETTERLCGDSTAMRATAMLYENYADALPATPNSIPAVV